MRITVEIAPEELKALEKEDKPDLTALEKLMYQHGVRAICLTSREAKRI